MYTFADLAKSLNRPTVYLSGLQARDVKLLGCGPV